jgi:hypothetical protein
LENKKATSTSLKRDVAHGFRVTSLLFNSELYARFAEGNFAVAYPKIKGQRSMLDAGTDAARNNQAKKTLNQKQ